MHTVTIVLLPRGTPDLYDAAAALLRSHYDRHLDYFTIGNESLDDFESAQLLGLADDEDDAKNVCFVDRLRPDFVPGAIVTPDGRWFDLADHGWRFIAGDTAENRAAWEKWTVQVRSLFDAHRDHIAFEVDTPS